MSEFKGTQKKWLKYRLTDNHKVYEIRNESNISICAINIDLEESEANAKLISCAPEMLEALKICTDYILGKTNSIDMSIPEKLIKKATNP